MAKLSAPNPAIFTTDPIESVFAKGVANRDNTAGLNAAWLLAFGNDRAENQDKYMGSLREANAMDAKLAQQEALLKLREQGMKSATDLLKEGFSASSLRAGGDLFNDPAGDPQVMTNMLRDLTKSKIFHNMQTGAGGAGGKDTVEETRTVWVQDPGGGPPYPVTVKAKGKDPATVRANLQSSMQGRTAIGGGNPSTLQQLHDKATNRQPNIE